MKAVKALYFCMALLLFCELSGAKKKLIRKKAMFIDVVDDCHEGTPNYLNNTKLVNNGNMISFDADVIITKKVNKVKARFIFYKCISVEDANCEMLLSGYVDHCRVFVEKGQFYSEIYNNMHPKMRCPLTPGLYHLRNATVDTRLTILAMTPLGIEDNQETHWKIKVLLYDVKKLKQPVLCFYAVYKIIQIKVRA